MKAQIVSFHCVLKDQMGKVISSTFNSDVITMIENPGAQLPGLVEGMQNLKKGEKRRIAITAERAYGFYDPGLVVVVPRKGFHGGEELQEGQEVIAQAEDGETKVFRVIQMTGNSITLDGNHPLAGQDLVFDIEATAARDATSEEIAESNVKITAAPYLH